jgi:hypothetical protein
MLAGEIGESLSVVLRCVRLDVRVPQGASVTLLERFACGAVPDGVRVSLDDLTSGRLVQLCFEVRLPAAAVGQTIALEFTLRAGDEGGSVASTRLAWQYASEEDVTASPRDAEVEARAAGVLSARMQDEALEHNRSGRFEEARRVVTEMAGKLKSLGQDNPGVRQALADAEADATVMGSVMDAGESKRRYFQAQVAMRSRDPRGQARKGGA